MTDTANKSSPPPHTETCGWPGEEVRQAMFVLEDFINEPPSYEDKRMVREYRHELYPKWAHFCNLIRAASLPRPPSGWRDIESAPKDYERILAWFPDAAATVVAFHSFDSWVVAWTGEHINPTHWQPLLPPPEAAVSSDGSDTETKPQSSCCQEDDSACGPFLDQEREIERLRTAIFNTVNDLNHKKPNIRAIRSYLSGIYNADHS